MIFKPSVLSGVLLGAVCSIVVVARADSSSAQFVQHFEEKIRPILVEHCHKCHSVQAQKTKGGLALDSREGVLTGGDSGPALVPGAPAESLILRAVRYTDPDLEMPPDEKLPDALITELEQWIQNGAPFPDAGTRPPETEPRPPWWDRVAETDLLPENRPIHEAIDYYIDQKLARGSVRAAPALDDNLFIRRLTLDLAGRIPTPGEAASYAADRNPSKKIQWVDGFIASPEFVRYQATEVAWFLLEGSNGQFEDYLKRVLRENRPWDRIFRDVLLVDGQTDENRGAEPFLKDRVRDPDRLVNDVSVRFFGVNISCAQCHDHPLVPAWKQDHYFGLKSFFNRTFLNGDFIAEREYGQVSFKTTSGESKQASLMFLTGGLIEEPAAPELTDEDKKREKERLEELKKNKQPVPPPAYSRRARLVEAALQPGQEGFFARAMVNYVWQRFFGHGLVMPLDQMHGQNAPSHPELLSWLARDFTRHGYDLRRLIRGVVLSAAYARSSASPGFERADPALFAVAMPRPLTPRQIAVSLELATRFIEPGAAEPSSEGLERIEKQAERWISKFDRPSENFQVSVEEALLFSNSDELHQELLNPSEGRLITRLIDLEDRQAIIRTAVWNILSRAPEPAELRWLDDYLARRADRPEQAIRQMVWALLTSPEFRFNH